MLDKDLAELYEVETKRLNEAVRRNIERFPEDFMFQLNEEEIKAVDQIYGLLEKKNLRSQIATSKKEKRGGNKYLPYAFTEQGVAMLSSVLRSKRAIQVNIQIMRIFTKLHEILANHKALSEKIETMEKKFDNQFQIVFKAIKQLITIEKNPRRKIGF